MGRSYVYPIINLNTNNPPEMNWHKIFKKNDQAGDILASFEIIKVITNLCILSNFKISYKISFRTQLIN